MIKILFALQYKLKKPDFLDVANTSGELRRLSANRLSETNINFNLNSGTSRKKNQNDSVFSKFILRLILKQGK